MLIFLSIDISNILIQNEERRRYNNKLKSAEKLIQFLKRHLFIRNYCELFDNILLTIEFLVV